MIEDLVRFFLLLLYQRGEFRVIFLLFYTFDLLVDPLVFPSRTSFITVEFFLGQAWIANGSK